MFHVELQPPTLVLPNGYKSNTIVRRNHHLSPTMLLPITALSVCTLENLTMIMSPSMNCFY